MRRSILDVELQVEAPEAVLAPIAAAYARFSGSGGFPVALTMDAAGLAVGGRRHPPIAGVDPTHQLYSRLVTALMQAIASHAVLHAAALVGDDGRALLIAAPSGFGKSSLAQELTRRGMRFLGDDYAPLDLDAGTIAPYPRAVAIRSDGAAPTPDVFRKRAARPGTPVLLGKQLLHVDEVLGAASVADAPAPLGRVAVLDSFEDDLPTRIDVGARVTHAEALDAALGRIPGVAVLGTETTGELATRQIAIDPSQRPTEALARVLEDPRVLFSEKMWSERPSFDQPPRIEPLSRRRGAMLLGRELLNARRDGRLLARHGGDPAELFLALYAALAPAECVRVRPGPFAATADLLERFASRAPRP